MKNAMLTLNNSKTPSMKIDPASERGKPRVGTDDGISNNALNRLILIFMLLMLGIAVASASNRDGISDETVLQHAVLDLDNGRFEEAARKLRALAVRHPESAYISYLLGICTMQLEEAMEEAIGHLSKCIARVGEHAGPSLARDAEVPIKAHYLLGSALESSGWAIAAADAYERYLQVVAQSEMTDLSDRVVGIIQRKIDSLRNVAQVGDQPLVLTNR